jgi:hypothetical protein
VIGKLLGKAIVEVVKIPLEVAKEIDRAIDPPQKRHG